ncbi:hypothetical protein H4R34_002734 [Dimargaris verticillata]|uniref:3-hydroxyacyl-CoA dehydrogenase n=1 Tax=Dimargaris verticillata TaxID=2761393 RepID=A0A9W8B3E3_9FUNG|nr:hypothetical protein H4R34_002734 [Dimargaris verticillata]
MYRRQVQLLRHLNPQGVAAPVQQPTRASSAALMHTSNPALAPADSAPAGSEVERPFSKVVVYGSGLMGSGIAQVAAQYNYQVTLVDLNQNMLDKGQGYIRSSLKRVARKKFADDASQQTAFVDNVMSRVKVSTDPVKPVEDADLVVEAIVENIKVKQSLFRSLDEAAPQHTVFTSNTSSLPIGQLLAATSDQRATQFAGLHFFNPVPQMKLVEVVKAATTSQQVVDSLTAFCQSIKKSPVHCNDTPGFIVNRLLVPYMMEALRMVDRGDASVRDVDTAMKLGAGYPMGPFELADYVGLDTLKFITDGWYKEGEGLVGDGLVAPSKRLDALVAAGNLGRKTGKGFYEY